MAAHDRPVWPAVTPPGDAWAALEDAQARIVDAALSPAQQRELLGECMARGQSRDPERWHLLWGYKHVATRRDLVLDAAGGAYRDDETRGRYVGLPMRDALAHARAAA